MFFKGIWTSIAKKPYVFVIFEGGGGVRTPSPRPLDPRMIIIKTDNVRHLKKGVNCMIHIMAAVHAVSQFEMTMDSCAD